MSVSRSLAKRIQLFAVAVLLTGLADPFHVCCDACPQTRTKKASNGKRNSDAIRVMSFNIRFGTARDGENHWKKRQKLVVQTIKKFQPDLLGTQETLGFQADYLKKNLSDYDYIGRSRDKDPTRGEQCGILFHRKRFEKVETGQFWLSETPDKVGSRSWDSSLPRIATWVVLKDKSHSNRKLVFLNTHFDHRGRKARLESAAVIRRWMEKHHRNDPVIITGDFNCGISSKPYKMLMSADQPKLIDSFRMVNRGHEKKQSGTFNGFRGKRNGARIDWVLHTNQFDIKSASINRFNQNGRYPSDHFPVTAILKWKQE